MIGRPIAVLVGYFRQAGNEDSDFELHKGIE